MLEGNVLYLVLGIAIGVLLTAKSVREVMAELPKAVYPYTIFGFLLFGASLFGATAAHDVAGGWLGFTCVVVVFLLYHLIGSEGLPTPLRSFFSFKWLPWPKKKEPSQPTDEVDSAAAGTET